MIIPTREDECRIIKELMQDTQMTLGASWYDYKYIYCASIGNTMRYCDDYTQVCY